MEPEETPSKQASEFIKDLVPLPHWRQSREQRLWATRIAIVLVVVLVLLTLISLQYEITPWDWIKVLAVPITIGAAVPLLNWLQKRRELAYEERRAQTAALLQYLEELTQLMLEKKDGRLVRMDITPDVLEVISARTEATGKNFTPEGSISLGNFLLGLKLFDQPDPIISLAGRDFSGVNWSGADLSQVDLTEAKLLGGANLQRAALNGADLRRAQLGGADLQEANLENAKLQQAILAGASNSAGLQWFSAILTRELLAKHPDMRVTNLNRAILVGADLSEADLSFVKLQGADLKGANLRDANLNGATGITNEELEQQAKSLEGTIMPDGSKHP